MKRLSLLFAACLLCFSPIMSHADKVDDYLREQMRKQHIPGLSLAIVKNGRIIKAKGYGLANVELHVSATPETVYEIGSITKQFTATALMMLVEQGKIGLDSKIATYLSGLPDSWQNVTVRQLLTHTSGIKGYTEVPDFEKITLIPASNAEVLKTVAAFPLNFPSGDKWDYSNTGYFLLGMIIEKTSGKSYAEFLKERIFIPLQMNATQINDLHTVIPNRASGYAWKDGALYNADFISMTWPFAAGAIVSTVTDLAKWDNALYTDRLLKPASWQQMWTPVKLNDGKPFGYGFGWFVEKVKDHTQLSHSGGIPGFTSYITRYPDDKLTVVVLTNQMINPARIGEGVAGLYLPAIIPPVAMPIADKEPLVTAQVRAIMEQLAEGKMDAERFTPELASNIATQLKAGAQQGLHSLGAIQTILLLARKDTERNREYRYRFVYKQGAMVVFCIYNKEGKVAVLSLQPE